MSYIEELRNLVCGQVEKYIRNVLRSENVDNDERSGFLSGESESDDYELSKLKDPKYLSKNQSSLLKSNDPSCPVNMIDSFNTPFDHIDRIFLQDFSSNLFTESNNYFGDLFSVEFGEKSIVNRIEMSGENWIDYSSVNEQFESGKFFIDSFTYTPFIDYSTVDSKVGIYSDEYLTKYNTGWYDVKSNFVDCNRRNMTSNLYELGNLEKDLYDAKIAFRNAIQNTEFTNRGGQIVPANAKVYIHTLCEHLVTLFAKLSNIRMCHEFYGLKSPHSEWDGMLALDIWYNMLYKEIDCGYSFDESYFDVNPMSKLKIQVERNGDGVTRRYVEYQGEKYDVQDETYTVGDYTIMTNGVDDGYALLWNDNVFGKIDSNAKKINDDRKWHVLPRGVLCKIHSIVNNQVPINAITDDSSGDFEWFKQSGKVYSDSSKSRYTKYTNLHLGRAYDVMSPSEYCAFTNTDLVDGKYVKPLIEKAISGMKKKMLISGCEALEDAFSVIRNEKLFNIFNSDSNEVEEFNPNNIEHYSESQCAIVIERIFSRLYKYLQFKSTTSEEFEKHINIDSGYKYLTTESLLKNDHVEYRNGDVIKSVYYDDNDTIPYLRYMSKLREYLNSNILTDEEKEILEDVVGDNGILTSIAASWIHENWDLCPLLKTRRNDQGFPQWFSRMVSRDSNDNNIIGKTIVIDYNLDQYMKVDGQTYVENVVYTIEDEDFRLDLSDFNISPIFDDGNDNHIDYELLGYSTDRNSNVVYSPDKILSQKDIPSDKSIIVLYAVWKRKYIVRFSHGATGIFGEMDDIVVEQNKLTTLPKCEFSPTGKSKLFTYYDNDEIWETTSSIVSEEDFNVEFDGWEYTFNGNRFVVEDHGNILFEQNQLNSYPIVVLTARWKPKYDSISFYVKGYKYCDVLIKRSENKLVYPAKEPKLLDDETQFLGWDILEGDYLSGIDRTAFVVCGDDDIPLICDDGEGKIVCEQDEVIGYGLKVNARIGYKTIKKFKLWFKYIDSDTKQPHEVYEYVDENSPIPVFHIHDEIDFGKVVKKFRYWRLESGNISSSMTILSDATLVAVYDDIVKPVEEYPELEKVNPNELNDEFVQQSSASQLVCEFNDINCLYVTNGNGDGDLNPNKDVSIFDSNGGSGCPFIQLLKLGITHKFDVATIIEIDDVTKLIQALLKINIDIAHREYFLRLDVPNDSSWWYGYIRGEIDDDIVCSENGSQIDICEQGVSLDQIICPQELGKKYISFEPCVEYKFSNMHASNQLKDGKLICCSGEDIERTIVPVNRELMNDRDSNHYNEYLYHYDYSNSLKSIMVTDRNPSLPVFDDCQKYYSIQPLCLYENTIIQSPVDVNGFVKHRLNKIERTDKQVQTYTSIVKKYRPIIVPSVHEIFNGNEYKSKYQVDKENTYGVFGWCSIPSKTMVNMEYNEHSIIVPSSYDRHNHVCGSNFLQMDCDLSNIYRTWDSELNKPVSNIKDSWYYLYNQRDWTYFLKPFFNIKQNNDVYAYFLDTFPDGHEPSSSNHLNGVVFEPSINGRTSDLSFNVISQTCRFLAKYHHNEMNFDILTKISNEIIPFSKLREMTSIDGEYNSVYGSRYVGLPESFKYPECDWIADKNKTSTYTNDYEYNIGWRHAIDDFDEESVWMYITMTIPVEQQSPVIEVKDIMPYVFWWSNRGLQGG